MLVQDCLKKKNVNLIEYILHHAYIITEESLQSIFKWKQMSEANIFFWTQEQMTLVDLYLFIYTQFYISVLHGIF